MQRRWSGWAGALIVLACAAWLLPHQRMIGDGHEYLIMSVAILQHGLPWLRAEDFQFFMQQQPARLAEWGIPADFYAQVWQTLQLPQPASWNGYARLDGGPIAAIHFWGYSLLAAPLIWVLLQLQANPAAGFLLLNTGCLLLAGRALAQLAPAHTGAAYLAVLLCGGSFYLAWTGPEVLSAACVLLALVAALEGAFGWAMLVAGIGALQSPSLIGLMPFALAARWVLERWPALALQPLSLPPVRQQLLQGLIGGLLAALPYWWFLQGFGLPSLIGKYFTQPDWLSLNRAHSLFFDLNQGMLAGLPGLMLAWLVLALVLPGMARRRWWLWQGGFLAVMLVMALPALVTLNWNSGAIGFMRYAYWLGMPLLLGVFAFLPQLPRRRAWLVLGVLLLGQAWVLGVHGIFGQRSNYNLHSALAQRVLRFQAHWYNPDPEIFSERTRGFENNVPLPPTRHVLWRHEGAARKLLRHQSHPQDAAYCPQGGRLIGSHRVRVDRGWEYLHAPFWCEREQDAQLLRSWDFDAANAAAAGPVRGRGWSTPEVHGNWTEGVESELLLADLPPGPLSLTIDGIYYGEQRESEVWYQGRLLGRIGVGAAPLDLPDGRPATLRLLLRHPGAISPLARKESADPRLLGLYLRKLHLWRRAQPEKSPARFDLINLSQ